MKSRTRVSSATLVVVCVFLLGALAHAQYRGSLQGTVTDAQGAVVPGAKVTLTDKETNRTQEVTTNEAGYYVINGLAPRPYKMEVVKDGFKKKALDDLKIIAEQANALNVELDIGQATETVNVSDAAPLIDTATSNLSGTVTAEQFQKLPSVGRDPFQLLQLAPGAFGDGARGGQNAGSNLPSTTVGGTSGTDGVFKIENGGQITANGARTGENNYQIDGVNTTSVTWGGTSVITPNEDSIKEVKVLTDNYDAENGRYRGAQVQIISQNGTNNYHGSFFFKVHRPGLNAYTRYNGFNSNTPNCIAPCGNLRDSDRYNDWGGSVGGPIIKNKLFAFFSYETLSNRQNASSSGGWYETSQLRGLAAPGTNAAAILTFPGVEVNGGSILDRTCADAGFSNGGCQVIAGQGLDIGSPLTTGIGVHDLFDPTGKHFGTGGNGNGTDANLDGIPDIAFITDPIGISDSTHRQYNGRLDFNATNKDLFAFSIYYVPNTSTGINGNGTRLMNLFNSTYTNRAMTALWDHTFSSTMLNELRVNAAGWINKDLASNPNGPFGLPQISFISSLAVPLQGYGIGSFNGFDQWTYAAKDVLNKVHGAHTMKMGGEFTRLLSVDAPFWADRPGYTFNNIWDFVNDAPIQENAQFDPITGVPSALRKDLRSTIAALFFQDNWKMRPNLTITAGLRWEYFGPIHEKNDKLATVEFGQGANFFTDMRVRTGGGQYNAQKANFGPQLGFAWSPGGAFGHDFNNKLVIRGGAGIAYNSLAQSNTLDVRFNPPFVSNGQSFSGDQITYIGTFPSDVHDPNGYASNPNAILTFNDRNLPDTGRIDLTALPHNLPTTYSYHYTLGGEYDLGSNWVASVGYQGSTTRHLTQHYNLYNTGAVQGLAFNPVVGGVTFYTNNGSGRFNALLLGLRHDFSRSFQVEGQYRLSKNEDSGSNAYAGPNYPFNIATGFGTSDFDTRHAFKLFGVWSPTIFKGGNSWMEKLVGGWSLSGILNVHTGFPWNPTYNLSNISGGFDPVFYFSPGGNGGGSSSNSGSSTYLPAAFNGGFHPDYHGADPATGEAFFTPPDVSGGVLFECLFVTAPTANCPSGQVAPGPIPQAPGVKRNMFTGPGYFNVDATLSKSFGLPTMPVVGENAKLEIRANFYNLFNKLNLAGSCGWNGVQCNINGANFGESQSSLGGRVIEMQARFSF